MRYGACFQSRLRKFYYLWHNWQLRIIKHVYWVSAEVCQQSAIIFSYFNISLSYSSSISDVELIEDPFDTSFTLDDSIEGDSEATLLNPSEERKFIVFESALLPLFCNCRSCGLRVTLTTSTYGTLLVIKGTCPCDHTFTWYSQPFVGRAPAGNLLQLQYYSPGPHLPDLQIQQIYST